MLTTSYKYHTSIETLPIDSWFKINKTNDLSLLKRNYLPSFLCLKPEIVWTKIYDEFIERVGLNDEFKSYLDTIKRIAIMQCDWVISPNPADKIRIKQEIRELEEKHEAKTIEYNEIIAKVSKMQGFRIDPKKVSVFEFYGYLKANNG